MEYIKRKSTNFNVLNDKKNSFIEIKPKKLILIKLIDQKFYEGRITIKNVTEKYVIYKIYINYNLNFSVTPSVYFIPPNESIVINVKKFIFKNLDNELTKHNLIISAIETENQIRDVNDAKSYIQRDDLYSPSNQQIEVDIEFDNCYSNINYENMKNERISIVKEYNEQLNINNITNPNEISNYINILKKDIELYQSKNEKLMELLNEFRSKNIVEHPKNIFEKSIEKIENDDNIPLFLVVFYCCLSYLIGNIISNIFS